MPTRDQDRAKRAPKQKPAPANDNLAQDIDRAPERDPDSPRGEAVTSGGNKIHGDMLDGIIPGRPSQPHTERETK